MRLPLLLLLAALIALPSGAVAEKAKSIKELADMYDSSRCKECHPAQYEQWEKSHHARPLMGVKGGLKDVPLAQKGGTAFSPDDPKKATMKTFPCFKCHLPQALTSAEDSVAVEYAEALIAGDKAKISKLQITCIVCHSDKAIIHKLTEGKPEKGVLYSTKAVDKHPDGVFKTVKKGSIMDHSVYCGQCHGLGPNFEFENPFQCATLYGNYIHAYIPRGGAQSCQDCHTDHRYMPDWDDHAATGKLLKDTVYLDVQTLGLEWLRKAKDWRPTVVVNTKIWHKAGHEIPDG